MKIFLAFIIFLIFSSPLIAQERQNNLDIAHLTGDFYLYKTYHDYQGNRISANALYLVTEAGVVLIDSPWDTTQFQPLLDSIKSKHNKDVVMCIATHWHEDRSAGLEYYRKKGIATYTTQLTDSFSRANKQKRAEYLMLNDSMFTVGQYSFQVFYPGPGHTQDNIVVWFPEEKILYGGCFIKSSEAIDLGNLRDADTRQWTASLNRVKEKFGKPSYIIPGHDDWRGTSSIDHTMKLVEKYNNKIDEVK